MLTVSQPESIGAMRKLALVSISGLLQFCLCLLPVAGADTAQSPEMKALNDRIKADPKNARLYLKRAELQLKYLDYDACIADATSSIKAKPTSEAYFLRAMASRDIGKLGLAENDFEKSAEL